MAAADEPAQRLTALTTEHFVLQGAISNSVNEQQARASMFLTALSGALVAMGFLADSARFLWFVGAILPAIFLVGALTVLRLVDIAMESMQSEVCVAMIRARYRQIDAESERLFSADSGRWPEASTVPSLAAGPVIGVLTTAASMVGCVDAILAGVGVCLLLASGHWLALPYAIAVGALAAVTLVGGLYAYQLWRIRQMDAWSEAMGVPSVTRGMGAGASGKKT